MARVTQSRNWTSVRSSQHEGLGYYTLVAEVYDCAREGASLSAILTSSAKAPARIFRITWPRWTFTVASLSPNSAAICLLRRPATIITITSHLRGVYLSNLFAVPQHTFPFAC